MFRWMWPVLIIAAFMPSTLNAQETDEGEAAIFADANIDYPKAAPVLGFIESRDAMDLNGDWNVIVDPMGVGLPGAIFGGFHTNRRAQTDADLVEFDFDTSDTLRVPGDWNSQRESLFFYQGGLWYHRKVLVEKKDDRLYHLSFGGANFSTRVFVNGEIVGEHEGGYVPFSFDVTDMITSGENVIIVHVDNRLTPDSVPTTRTDWWPYGGLTRDVALVSTPEGFIRNAKIDLVDRETKQVRVTVTTENIDAGTEVSVAFPSLNVSAGGTIDMMGQATLTLSPDIDLWTPEAPTLYDVEINAGQDRLSDRIGFRTIETNGQKILLNGAPIKLKGISTHEEPIGEAGVAYSAAHAKRILQEAKALGTNFVRAAHYPYSRHMARAADEMGLLLWAEIPVYWNINWDNPETLAVARDQMARLITRDWNRASVVIWSVANETPLSDARMAFLNQLIDDTRALDDTRLVSAALLGGGRKQFEQIVLHLAVRGLAKGDLPPKAKAVFEAIVAQAGDKAPAPDAQFDVVIEDPLGASIDIISYNEYYGWYYSVLFAQQTGVGEDVFRPLMLDLMKDMTITANVDKPIHISEFGAGAKSGRRSATLAVWSEDYQAAVYDAQIAMLRQSQQVQGMTPWILKDFRAMLRTLPGVQDYYNRKGLVDPDGKRKLAFEVLQEFYDGEWE